jgi:hypothetical protein
MQKRKQSVQKKSARSSRSAAAAETDRLSSASSPSQVAPLDRFGALEFDALRNAVYHSSRRRSYELRHKLVMASVLIFSTAVFGDFLNSWKLPLVTSQTLLVFPIVASIFDLVFSFGEKARNHQILQKQFYEVLAEIEEL